MDCIGMGTVAFVAVLNKIQTFTNNVVADGSPVFQISERRPDEMEINVVQYFTEPHQNRVYLR